MKKKILAILFGAALALGVVNAQQAQALVSAEFTDGIPVAYAVGNPFVYDTAYLHVKNTGTTTITGLTIQVQNGYFVSQEPQVCTGGTPFATSQGAFNLAPGATQIVSVTFKPAQKGCPAGAYRGQVKVIGPAGGTTDSIYVGGVAAYTEPSIQRVVWAEGFGFDTGDSSAPNTYPMDGIPQGNNYNHFHAVSTNTPVKFRFLTGMTSGEVQHIALCKTEVYQGNLTCGSLSDPGESNYDLLWTPGDYNVMPQDKVFTRNLNSGDNYALDYLCDDCQAQGVDGHIRQTGPNGFTCVGPYGCLKWISLGNNDWYVNMDYKGNIGGVGVGDDWNDAGLIVYDVVPMYYP